MVTLAETTELSEMHDALGKWTQLWPSHKKEKSVSQGEKRVSQGDTATCLCHADNCQTATSNVQKYLEDKFVRNSAESGYGGGGCGGGGGGVVWWVGVLGGVVWYGVGGGITWGSRSSTRPIAPAIRG